MRAMVSIAALGLLVLPAVPAQAQAPAQPLPQWAYPLATDAKPPDATKPIQLPGSTKSIHRRRRSTTGSVRPTGTRKITSRCRTWSPTARSRTRSACDLCHLTSGGGHPEFAGISGLPSATSCASWRNSRAASARACAAPIDDADRQGRSPTRTPRRRRNISPQ